MNTIKEKLEYLDLDLDDVPKSIMNFTPFRYRVNKLYEEGQYKQYRYVPIKNIEILLSPTNRLDPVEEKYKKASPLAEYLDNKNEENFIKHTIFLNMFKKFKIEDVEKIEAEQLMLNNNIPFKVKYNGNYLWQIYYSENQDQYFMIVPTEDVNNSTFFFLLKKQLEKKRTGKIFVPIRNVDYSSKILKKSQIEDIQNYMWLFTKEWPLIYEVYDKNDNPAIHIVGETEVYEKIKSLYKIVLDDTEEANRFYRLLKAMFILQTELLHYFEFKTKINQKGEIEFYIEDRKVEYSDIAEWLSEEYFIGEQKNDKTIETIEKNKIRLEKLKIRIAEQEIEYLAKEKQISTFLECKKTFFGKVKYFFKYSGKGKKNKNKDEIKKNIEEDTYEDEEDKPLRTKRKKKDNYTIEEIIELYKELEKNETKLKNSVMDINSLKLKVKNMDKKIENAAAFIDEIDNHKKSIFEFWKYSNKDEVATLPEGEEEEINIIKKITKVFDYEDDLEKFGQKMDEFQRKALTKEETDSVYIASTNVIEILNKITTKTINPKNIENSLTHLKQEAKQEKVLPNNDDFDIFGGMDKDTTKVSKIKNKKHREIAKDKYSILEINKNTKSVGFKMVLESICKNVKKALRKVTIPEEFPVYIAFGNNELDMNQFNVFDINPQNAIKDVLEQDENEINFYKINLKEGVNAISYTNIIFYDNQNKTLPLGQDLSTKILVDTTNIQLGLKEKTMFKIVQIDDENEAKINVKKINLMEYDVLNIE